jgi:hypothetical protein
MNSTATPDEWDAIAAADAAYRERITALARSIPMAGTLPGLQLAAEAIAGVECEVYEAWPIIDAYAATADARLETTGNTGTDAPTVVYVRPKKQYTPVDATSDQIRAAERLRTEDEMSLVRVLSKLKPADVLLTVDNSDMALNVEAKIAYIASDSHYWEIIPKVRPRPDLAGGSEDIYPRSSVGVAVASDALRALPTPPFSQSQGDEWTYNSSVVTVRGYALDSNGVEIAANNWESVAHRDGLTAYLPERGIADERSLTAARIASDGLLVAHPYSGTRVAVPTHG